MDAVRNDGFIWIDVVGRWIDYGQIGKRYADGTV